MADVITYTPNYRFPIPAFNKRTWHEEYRAMASIIDATLAKFIALNDFTGVWDNSIAYTVGERVVDDVDGNVYECLVAHTSAATGLFSEDRADNATYWETISVQEQFRGTWVSGTAYALRDFVLSNGIYAVCIQAHTAGATFAGDSAKWEYLVDTSGVQFPTGVANTMLLRNAGNTAYDTKTAAQIRAFLDLEIGTDVQAYDNDLSTLAAVTPGATGLALLDDATAAAGRATLGMTKTVIQRTVVTLATVSNITATTPAVDDTIPQITEGTELISVPVTVLDASSRLQFLININGTNSTGGQMVIALHRAAVNDAIQARVWSVVAGLRSSIMMVVDAASPGAGAFTFSVRMGVVAGAFRSNAEGGGTRELGGSQMCSVEVLELL